MRRESSRRRSPSSRRSSWSRPRRPGGGARLDRRQAGPPPTPVPPNGRRPPFLGRLETPGDAGGGADDRGAVGDARGSGLRPGAVPADPDRVRPIASLTKLMTALIVLDREDGRLDRRIRVDPDAVFGRNDYGGRLHAGPPAGGADLDPRAAGRAAARLRERRGRGPRDRGGRERLGVRGPHERRCGRASGCADEFASPHGLDDRGPIVGLGPARAAARRRGGSPSSGNWSRRGSARPVRPGPPADPEPQRAALALSGRHGGEDGVHGRRGLLPDRHGSPGRSRAGRGRPGRRDEVFSDAASLLNHGFAAYRKRTLVEEASRSGAFGSGAGRCPWSRASRWTRSSARGGGRDRAAPPSGPVGGVSAADGDPWWGPCGSAGRRDGRQGAVVVGRPGRRRRSRPAPGGAGCRPPSSGPSRPRDRGARRLRAWRISSPGAEPGATLRSR